MASSSCSSIFGIATLLLLSSSGIVVDAQVAPGPSSGPASLTSVLVKGNQYNTFLRLLKETQVGTQIESQLNNSFNGLTVFAPTDNAFNQLKAGTLNSLTSQEQVNLVLYHVLPRFYSLSMFETVSNPVRTQASGSNGVYNVNVTSTSSQVNVSTGVDAVPINNVEYSTFPLAVYSVDQVLLPFDLFGPKPPAAAPAPVEVPKTKPKKGTPGTADAPADQVENSNSSAASMEGRSIAWGLLVGAALMCMKSLF